MQDVAASLCKITTIPYLIHSTILMSWIS